MGLLSYFTHGKINNKIPPKNESDQKKHADWHMSKVGKLTKDHDAYTRAPFGILCYFVRR